MGRSSYGEICMRGLGEASYGVVQAGRRPAISLCLNVDKYLRPIRMNVRHFNLGKFDLTLFCKWWRHLFKQNDTHACTIVPVYGKPEQVNILSIPDFGDRHEPPSWQEIAMTLTFGRTNCTEESHCNMNTLSLI